MTPGPTARTRLVALLGDPVSHSLSPRFQNAAFREAAVDAVYLALRCTGTALPCLLRGIAESGGAGNVTVPHKEVAFGALDRATDAALGTGACNTFWLADGAVWGDNTDVQGFQTALQNLLGKPPQGLHVLLVGAGGAARAAAFALLADGVARITLVNRSLPKAEALAGHFSSRVIRVAAEVPDNSFDVAVNATSLGLRPEDPVPVPESTLVGAALDLVYGPDATPWVRRMQSRGIPAADGRDMLLHQGAAAFRRWFNQEPPLEVMRRALLESR